MTPVCLSNITSSKLRWEHPVKLRYYQIFLFKDLLNDWIVTKSWGSLHSSRGGGGVTHMPCDSLEEAKKLIVNLSKLRNRRGYVLQDSHAHS